MYKLDVKQKQYVILRVKFGIKIISNWKHVLDNTSNDLVLSYEHLLGLVIMPFTTNFVYQNCRSLVYVDIKFL